MSKYTPGQKVDLKILRETPLGFAALINGTDEGLLYHNEIFESLQPGDELPGYVKKIRENGSVDLLLQPLGHQGADELGERILAELKKNKGFLPLSNKTHAEEIYHLFGVSKKKYKMAIGGLYKKRLIKVADDGIYLNSR
jgi:uncharacterized protein